MSSDVHAGALVVDVHHSAPTRDLVAVDGRRAAGQPRQPGRRARQQPLHEAQAVGQGDRPREHAGRRRDRAKKRSANACGGVRRPPAVGAAVSGRTSHRVMTTEDAEASERLCVLAVDSYFGGIRSAPSRRIDSPLSIAFSTMWRASAANSRRLAEARRERDLRRQRLARRIGQQGQHRGVERARRDGADADADRGEVARDRQRHRRRRRPSTPSTRPGRSGRRTPRPRRC